MAPGIGFVLPLHFEFPPATAGDGVDADAGTHTARGAVGDLIDLYRVISRLDPRDRRSLPYEDTADIHAPLSPAGLKTGDTDFADLEPSIQPSLRHVANLIHQAIYSSIDLDNCHMQQRRERAGMDILDILGDGARWVDELNDSIALRLAALSFLDVYSDFSGVAGTGRQTDRHYGCEHREWDFNVIRCQSYPGIR